MQLTATKIDAQEDKSVTLRALIASLGKRTNVVAAARKRLLDAGHEYTTSAIYSTIQRNGSNNPTIAAALLDAIEAAQAERRSIDDRRAKLASA
ncbi:hypothetical protein JAO73_01630 [Hymenobacter sp. BT523]|uniref:hypothetical protein n=1 Tax=Hymenobacter sp. BT523 TaxID=2795725 RepID=UPI0018EB9774|nr:hypothetical protein [Hymenobacter sp. BT523]MBJ6107694.1 hypothetical protein [Hymenobacter sp. BT523]